MGLRLIGGLLGAGRSALARWTYSAGWLGGVQRCRAGWLQEEEVHHGKGLEAA